MSAVGQVALQLPAFNADAVGERLAGGIASAEIHPSPAPFIFIENALPAEVYRAIPEAYARSAGQFTEQIHKGDPKVFFGSYRDRLELKVPEGCDALEPDVAEFWRLLMGVFGSKAFFGAVLSKFEEGFLSRYGSSQVTPQLQSQLTSSLLVTRHRPNYYLGPHTDRFEKVVTCILNCAEREGLEHLGTAMYTPKQKGFTCRGVVHHDPQLFDLQEVVPYRPNSILIFFRDDRLFHGVRRLQEADMAGSDRPNIQFNLWDRRKPGSV